MSILTPDLVWIDGICCRVRYLDAGVKSQERIVCANVDRADLYDEDNEELDDEIIYTELSNGRIQTSMAVPQCFIGYLIGTKGATKKRIESETKTDIKIPPRGQSGDVVVTGCDKMMVSKAVRRIKLIVISSRHKQMITHFFSIPMNSNGIQDNFNKFKEEILESSWGKHIHPSIFTEPKKLHITLVTLFLADEEERNIAKDIGQRNNSSVIREHFANLKDTSIQLRGVSYMNDDPRAVHVLYANVIGENLKLDELFLKMKETYNKTGFLCKNRESINLHVTLMNSKNYSEDSVSDRSNENKNRTHRIAFDASQILEKYKNYEFGSHPIKEIHLSQISTIDSNGYYKATCVISL